MFAGWKCKNAFGLFKSKLLSTESSLERGLLDVLRPPEVELSDYQRLSTAGSESPSGLLNGEISGPEPIADLDTFLQRVYEYYHGNGLTCIVTRWVIELLVILFIILCIFMTLFINWVWLKNAKCEAVAHDSLEKSCDLLDFIFSSHPLLPFSFSKGLILVAGVFSSIIWVFYFLRFPIQLKDILQARDFYHNSLNIADQELQTITWPLVLEKIVQLQSVQQLCVVKDLSAHELVMRIMRKENYLIGMLNKGVLALPIPKWFPGAGPAFRSGGNGRTNYLILTRTFEWSLNYCILQSMFDRNFSIRRDFISNPYLLRKRLKIVGILMLMVVPFMLVLVFVHFVLRHIERFYKHPSILLCRKWSNLSKWMFREFNEVDHSFRQRIFSSVGHPSVEHASDYLNQFRSPIVSLIAKFIVYVAGGLTGTLILIAFLEESLLQFHIFGRKLVWYAAGFGTLTAIGRAAISDDYQVRDPARAMSLVVQDTHYMPKCWRGKESTTAVQSEFQRLFQYNPVLLAEDIISLLLTPYLLCFVVPKRVNDVLEFISDYTAHVDGVGHVCSFSLFDFEAHGNAKYGSPFNIPQDKRSCQGKMEKSFLSFHTSYPFWEPDMAGKLFLSNLEDFQQRELAKELSMPFPSLPYIQQNHNDTNVFSNSFTFGGGLRVWDFPTASSPSPWAQLQTPLLMNKAWQRRPYLLDRYYMDQVAENNADLEAGPRSPSGSHQRRDLHTETGLVPPMEHHRDRTANSWASGSTDTVGRHADPWALSENRIGSHNEASTSRSLYQGSLIKHSDINNITGHTDIGYTGRANEAQYWWARTGHSSGAQNSFPEPPTFGGHGFHHHQSNTYSGVVLEEDEETAEPERIRFYSIHEDDDDHDKDGAFVLPFDNANSNNTPNLDGFPTRLDQTYYLGDSC